MTQFDIAPLSSSIIMVVGVGGGGGNAVNHMFKMGITDVSFMVCNTDRQALERSPIPNKIQLGRGGLGAGNKPERGRLAAMDSVDEIRQVLEENDTKMVFVTAGMGGGTGTGAAPVIAKVAKDMGILTVAIVTIPFKTEGRKRIEQAIEGIEQISHCVDSLLVINNENIHEIYGELTLSEAFDRADDILATAAKSIAEIITTHYKVNVDFEDVRTVMQDSGVALMGSASGSGEDRALRVAELAMSSPLLNHKDISGAQNVLLNITSGSREVTLSETYQITEYIQERAGNNNATDLIWGAGQDESLGDDIRITVIATGFGVESIPALKQKYSSTLGATMVVGSVVSGDRREVVQLDELEVQVAKPREVAVGDDDFAVVTRASVAGFTATSVAAGASDFSAGSVSSVSHSVVSESVGFNDVLSEVVGSVGSVGSVGQDGIGLSIGDGAGYLSDQEIEIPAWVRRGRNLDVSVSDGVKPSYENLEAERKSSKKDNEVNLQDLFE